MTHKLITPCVWCAPEFGKLRAEVQRLQGEVDAALSPHAAAGLLVTLKAECEKQHARAEAAESSLARVQQERDEFVNVAARVVIVNCFKCGQEYPQWSVLSSMTCPDCKVAAVEAALAALERDNADLKSQIADGEDAYYRKCESCERLIDDDEQAFMTSDDVRLCKACWDELVKAEAR